MSGQRCIPQMREWIRVNAPSHMRDVWTRVLDTAESAIEWHNTVNATGGTQAAFDNVVVATRELHDDVIELEEEMMT